MDYKQQYKIDLGKRIAYSRLSAELSQVALAIMMKCKQSHVAFYETGKRVPKDATLKRLADELKIDYLWLKYGDETYYDVEETEFGKSYIINHFPGKADKNRVIKCLDQLDEDDLSAMEEFAKLLIMEKNPEIKQKYFDDKKAKNDEAIAEAKKYKANNPKVTSSAFVARKFANLYKYYNDTFMQIVKGEITMEQAEEETWLKDAESYPEIADYVKEYKDNPENHTLRSMIIEMVMTFKDYDSGNLEIDYQEKKKK